MTPWPVVSSASARRRSGTTTTFFAAALEEGLGRAAAAIASFGTAGLRRIALGAT